MKLLEALWRRFQATSRATKLWYGTGAFLVLGSALTETDTCLGLLLFFLAALWLTPTVLFWLYQLWLKLTYRISVRLFLSYLLIGVLPFLLFVGVLAFAGYVLIGQYASAEYGDVVSRVRDELAEEVREALDAAEEGGPEAGVRWLEKGLRLPEELARVEELVDGVFASGGKTWSRGEGEALPVPAWIADDDVVTSPFRYGGRPMLAAVGRRGGNVVAVAVRLDPKAAATLSEGHWYQLSFPEEDDADGQDDAGAEEPEPEEPEAAGEGAEAEDGLVTGLLNRRWIVFARVGPDQRRWSDGEPILGREFVTFIRTSPREAATDLFRASPDFREALWISFLLMCSSFLVIYLGAVGLAAYHILGITRATARLTRGALQVQAGHLDYRIPVKYNDQLGDLAVAFNQMTESVGSMLDEVAEKERLKNELGLAREIQQSLLPGSELRHGSILVHAYFRPAAEVGGDYFDLFPLEPGHLIVAAGDVAGHGLPTGLLMAMVKSAVATLIGEGLRGAEILEKVNELMLRQPREHRMVTLAIADIDVEAGFAEITNAAHPPVYVSREGVREVLLPALPVGYPWRKPPPSERIEIESGSRLVFYSDGLVEAVDGEGEQFGYERLKAFLEDFAELSSDELLARLLKELEEYTAGRPPDDDLTLLVIDCGVHDAGVHER